MQEALNSDKFDFYTYLFDSVAYRFQHMVNPHLPAIICKHIYRYYFELLKITMETVNEKGLYGSAGKL